jgi:signal transduction histidine kinase
LSIVENSADTRLSSANAAPIPNRFRDAWLARYPSDIVGGIDASAKWPNCPDVADAIAQAVFGLLFESTTDAIFIAKRETGRVVSANVVATELLALDVDAVVGKTVDELSYEPRDLSEPGHYEDVALRRADDYPVYVTLNVAYVEEETHGALAAYTARDTSERRSLERELLAKHSALFAAYADLERAYAQLHETKQELEARNREIAMLAWRAGVGELVAGIAHHLNNPVGALSSTIRRLGAQVTKLAPEQRGEIERLVARIGELANRIESNVGAIVQTSRAAMPADAKARRELPPELETALSAFTNRLDDTTKEPS